MAYHSIAWQLMLLSWGLQLLGRVALGYFLQDKCAKTERSAPRGIFARIHPSTEEPANTLRKVRRRSPKELPS
eukprot:8320844-Pyramimonas_sp.AAC.1